MVYTDPVLKIQALIEEKNPKNSNRSSIISSIGVIFILELKNPNPLYSILKNFKTEGDKQ